MRIALVIQFFVLCFFAGAQNWSLKLSSNVELRTWKLTSSASKSEKSLGGASIALFSKDDKLISQTTSDPKGDFVIDVPANGDFILKISFAGCNTKKFCVTTKGVPESVAADNFKPTVVIGGFVMSRPFKGVDYIGLNEPLVKVEYKGKGQNFDKDEVVTNRGLDIVSKIYDSENSLIQKFCSNNKLGDEALKKNNCPLAKSYYLKALDLLPDEPYPAERLKLAEECIQKKKDEEEALAAKAQLKSEEQKLAAEKKKEEAELKRKNEQLAREEAARREEEQRRNRSSQKEDETAAIKPKSGGEEAEPERKSGGGNSKYSVKQVLGADKYKEAIKKADEYFKMKRYAEAKLAYEEALAVKPGDPHAVSRLDVISKAQPAPR